MTPLAKQSFMHVAEVIDGWRVFPRLFLAACLIWTMDITHILLAWYTKLPSAERSLEASGFASIVFLAVFGYLKMVFDVYVKSGRDWTVPVSSTTVTSVSTQQTSINP